MLGLDGPDPEFLPHMLAQLEDELARSRKREAFWVSLVVHIGLVLIIFFAPQWLPRWARPHLLSADRLPNGNSSTFITLPPDRQTPPKTVHTDKLSDKNRIAETPHPQLDRKMLEALETQGNRMAPGLPGPPLATQAAPQTPPGQPQARQTPAQPAPPPPPESSPWAALQQKIQQQETRPEPRNEASGENPFHTPSSAGSMIAQATRNTSRSGSFGSGGAGYGMGYNDRRQHMGNFDVLNDTQGVDFGPYLARLHPPVEMNWINLAPESVRPPLMKHGKVIIHLFIMPDGKVSGMRIESSSGDVALDRAAWGALTASSPFPPLPSEFHGPYLELLCGFFYNPTAEEMSQMP